MEASLTFVQNDSGRFVRVLVGVFKLFIRYAICFHKFGDHENMTHPLVKQVNVNERTPENAGLNTA